jgi:hypothetical protein
MSNRTVVPGLILAVVGLASAAQAQSGQYEYRLLATNKTGTMQKELTEVGDQGFEFVGITVAETAFGGNEVVTITGRKSK